MEGRHSFLPFVILVTDTAESFTGQFPRPLHACAPNRDVPDRRAESLFDSLITGVDRQDLRIVAAQNHSYQRCESRMHRLAPKAAVMLNRYLLCRGHHHSPRSFAMQFVATFSIA